MPPFFRRHRSAFTLVELLVSMVALALFILIVTQLVNSASTITTIGNKHMGADSEGRSVLDRMAVDFAQMVKRTDVDFFGKNTVAPNSVGSAMSGGTTGVNDQIAFFSTAPGYYPTTTTTSQSPVSLVAYRINAKNQLERMGKGLVWNGVSSTYTPMVFLTPTTTIAATWPAATTNATDPAGNYEIIGPYVFRFEYYYLINGQTVGATTYSSILSDTPFLGTNVTGHNAVNAFQDVSAIGVTIAVIDPQSRVLVSDSQLGTLITLMSDFKLTMHFPSAQPPCSASGSAATQPGDLDAQWQCEVNATIAASRTATSAGSAASPIRIYSRIFPIAH